MDVKYDDSVTFSYTLKHKTIQRKNNRFGYTMLFSNTMIGSEDVLRIYKEKDVVEKGFACVKLHLEPLFSRSDKGIRARWFLTIRGYIMVVVIALKC